MFADHRLLLVLGVAATQACVLLAWAARSSAGRAIGVPLVGALAYGVAASVGYLSYTGYQFHLPLIRVELTVALVLMWRALEKVRSLEPAKFEPAARMLQIGVAVTVLVAGPLTAYGPSSVVRTPDTVEAVVGGCRTIARGECRLSDRLTEHRDQLVRAVEANQTRPGPPSIWSEYAGLLEDHFGVFHPTHDYIIHARGPNGSADYLAAFRAADPEFAFTFHQGYWPHVQKYHSVEWGFYEELFANYEPIARTWAGHLWKRRPGPWKTAPETTWVPVPLDHPDAFTLPAQPLRDGGLPVMVVEVEYEICRTPACYLPVVGQSPRYLLYQFGCHTEVPVPARPYRERMTFPVVLNPGQPAHFYAAVRSLVGGRWVLKAVRARPLTGDTARHYLESLRL